MNFDHFLQRFNRDQRGVAAYDQQIVGAIFADFGIALNCVAGSELLGLLNEIQVVGLE